MRKKTVSIKSTDYGVIVTARVGDRKVTVRPSKRSGLQGFCNDESAKRAWRKYAQANGVSNYQYRLD